MSPELTTDAAQSPNGKQQLTDSTQLLGLSQAISNAAQAAPNIDPASAATVGSVGGDITGNAQAVQHAHNQAGTIAAANKVNQQNDGGLFGALSWVSDKFKTAATDVGKGVLAGVSDIGQVLNKPLQLIQHEYRYLHDIEARHGPLAALEAGVFITAGAVGGTLIAGPAGTALGAEAGALVSGQGFYNDSWDRTTNGNTYRDPHTGNVVSFGRDMATLVDPALQHRIETDKAFRESGQYGQLSGILDGIGDVMTDPVGLGGKIVGAARSVEGAPGVLKRVWGGTSINPDNVDQAYEQYRSVRNTVHDLATHDAGWIASHHPKLIPIIGDSPAGVGLGNASTDEEVLGIFKSVAKTAELKVDQMPTQTFVTSSLKKLNDAAANYDGPGSENFLFGPARWTRRFEKLPGATLDSLTHDWLSKELDPDSAASAQDLGRIVRYSQDKRTAQMVMAQWINAAPAERIIIAKNAYMDMLAKMAHFEPVRADNGEVIRKPGGGAVAYGRTVRNWRHPMGAYEELTNAEVRSSIKEQMDTYFSKEKPGQNGTYGGHLDGTKTKDIYDEKGNTFSAAVTEHQVGNIGVPSFSDAKRMGAQIAGARDISGKLDAFAYAHITAPFFKRFVLLSLAYANHIALAEIIPNTFRLGLKNMARGYYYSAVTKMGYKSDPAELKEMLGWLMDHGSPEEIKGQNQLFKEAAAIYYLKTGGHGLTQGISAGDAFNSTEYTSADKAQGFFSHVMKSTPRQQRGNDFSMMDKTDPHLPASKVNNGGYFNYWRDWHREITRSAAHRAAAWEYVKQAKLVQDLGQMTEDEAIFKAGQAATKNLEKMGEKGLKRYMRSKNFSTDNPPAGWRPIDDWGQEVAANMRAVLGPAGNAKLLSHIMNGTTPTIAELAEIPEDEWPTMVKGRVMVPNMGVSAPQRLANFGFRKFINPYVNFLSRQPIALNDFAAAWKEVRPMVADGRMDFDQAANLAMSRSTLKSTRYVHNIHDRSQLSETLRNWVPFFFAQEQAYRRMGRLLATDPGAFRKYQLMISGVGTMAAKQQNTQGDNYFSFPGGTWLATGTTELGRLLHIPIQNVDVAGFQGSLSSANVIFPLSTGFRPDLSPLATIAAKSFDAMFPELGPELSKIVGNQSLSSGFLSLIIPNSTVVRTLSTIMALASKNGNGVNDRAFASSMMQTMQLALYQQDQAMKKWEEGGEKGPQPSIVPDPTASLADKQRFINRIKNQTFILYMTNTVLGFFSPVSPSVSIKNFNFPTELSNDIAKSGSVSKGITEFLLRHPDATPWTVFQSFTPANFDPTGGVATGPSFPSNDAGEQWINDNRSFIEKYPAAALFVMPAEKGKYDSAVYNEQLAQRDRVKRTPDQFLTALYVNAGNQLYYPSLAQHEKVVNSGVKGVALSREYTNWNQWLDRLKAANPTWAVYGPLNYAAKDATMAAGISDLVKMQTAGDYPRNDQSAALLTVLDGFKRAEAQYMAAGNTANYSHSQKLVKDSWQSYILQVGKENPTIKTAVDTLFLEALGQVSTNG